MAKREVNTWLWWGYLRETAHFKSPRVDEEIILKLIINKFIGKLWTRFVLVHIWGKIAKL